MIESDISTPFDVWAEGEKLSATGMIQALLFDVFGTVVDWRTSLIRWFERYGRENSLKADWAALADN